MAARISDWSEFLGWQVDRGVDMPLIRQVYRRIRDAILERRLKPGRRLPSSRALAAQLGVARASVVSAYEQLLAEGYVAGRVGAGTFVAADLPDVPAKRARHRGALPRLGRAPRLPPLALTDLAQAALPGDARPFNTGRSLVDGRTLAVLRSLFQQELRHLAPDHLGYGSPAGLPALRAAIADYLAAARAVRCGPEQIVVTAGTQHAIDLVIRAVLSPGDAVWLEDPGYPLTHDALRAAGMAVRPVPVDGQGLDVAAAWRLAPRARAAIVTPSHQFPTGAVLSMARRLALLAWAREAGAWIVEDDYASEFRYSGPPLASLQGLDDGERVIYVGTLNKALFAGLRLGYAVVPPALIRRFAALRHLADRQPPSLVQSVAAAFIADGHLASHIRRMRLRYREQRDALVRTLARHGGGAILAEAPDQGMHLAAVLAGGRSDRALERAALDAGIVVRALSRLYRVRKPRQGLLLGFSGYPPSLIVPAAARLARLAAAMPPRRPATEGRD